jgi:inner membrane protein
MHIPTHLMSGWCVANVFTLTARERAFCMAAASLADLDCFSRVFGQEAYWDYHHVVCHNLAFALLMSVVFAACSVHWVKGFIIYLALAHLHLLLDY